MGNNQFLEKYVKDERIPVFCIHLEYRKDRLEHIKKQFFDKENDFNLVISNFEKSLSPAKDLYNHLVEAIQCAKENDLEYFIFCEDDHIFTENYSLEGLRERIDFGIEQNADIFQLGFNIDCKKFDEFFQKENFVYYGNGYFQIKRKWNTTQFMVIYKSLYDKFLNIPIEKIENFTWKYHIDKILGNWGLDNFKTIANKDFFSIQTNIPGDNEDIESYKWVSGSMKWSEQLMKKFIEKNYDKGN